MDKGALMAVPADEVKYLQVLIISDAHSQHFKYLYLKLFSIPASCRLANGKFILRLWASALLRAGPSVCVLGPQVPGAYQSLTRGW